jgi:hypothetical protein
MNKFWLAFQGYFSCVSWIPGALLKFIWEECPDLKFWKRHTNLDDHIWYAERVNGRIAMLALTFLLIWCITHDIKLNEILF